MGFQDKSLLCSDCGADFTFSAEEQELFASRGYTNEPKRCPLCRQARKERRYGSRAQREMFSVICAQCGNEAEVPFQPREDRPVYCSDCYNKMRASKRY